MWTRERSAVKQSRPSISEQELGRYYVCLHRKDCDEKRNEQQVCMLKVRSKTILLHFRVKDSFCGSEHYSASGSELIWLKDVVIVVICGQEIIRTLFPSDYTLQCGPPYYSWPTTIRYLKKFWPDQRVNDYTHVNRLHGLKLHSVAV